MITGSIPSEHCPYTGCTQPLSDKARDACSCELKCPLVRCPNCALSNRSDAQYCRACQAALPQPKPASRTSISKVGFVQVPGEFHYPPMVHRGFLWCLASNGSVWRISPRAGARALRLTTQLPGAAAGFNRFAVIDAMEAEPPVRGPVLVAGDPAGIYALSLLTGAPAILFRPGGREEVVANATAEESIGYRGLASTSEIFCFLTRTPGENQARLRVRYFHPQRAGEDAVTVAGSSFLAPIIAGQYVGVCSDEEIAIYNLTGQSSISFQMPRAFRPFFKRPYQANVPPGGLPFTVAPSDEGPVAFVAGLENDRPGILRALVDRHYATFEPFSGRVCIANASPEGLAVNLESSADFLGVERPKVRLGDLMTGMPIGYRRPHVAWFNRPEVAGSHRLTVFTGTPAELTFDDPECNEDSCCAISFCGDELMVGYLNRAASDRGLKFAHWRLT